MHPTNACPKNSTPPHLATIRNAVSYVKDLRQDCYITENMLRVAVKEGRLRSIKVGNRNIVDVDDVLALLRGN